MAIEIYWSQFAEDKLQDIFNYYKIKAGVKTAAKIIDNIITAVTRLETHPEIGVIEELLLDRVQKFRYVVSDNYKIIYYLSFTGKRIVIANVFDMRQNPLKIVDTKS